MRVEANLFSLRSLFRNRRAGSLICHANVSQRHGRESIWPLLCIHAELVALSDGFKQRQQETSLFYVSASPDNVIGTESSEARVA